MGIVAASTVVQAKTSEESECFAVAFISVDFPEDAKGFAFHVEAICTLASHAFVSHAFVSHAL
ncbi:MAG: hypothetical protein E6Q88_06780 [Lysobacteraceae bacterium]|nr:MAG: hypothetical protein E6Q88_06780 [Xanthomonadaceae bacterium]